MERVLITGALNRSGTHAAVYVNDLAKPEWGA